MPLYEFRCNRCGTVAEFLAKTGETGGDLFCPECTSSEQPRTMSVAAAITSSWGEARGRTCCRRAGRCDNPPCETGQRRR